MSESNVELAHKLESKVSKLIDNYKDLKERYSAKEQELEQVKDELAKSKQAYSDLESQFKIYRVAMSVCGNSDDKNEAKRHINQIVREIDKCIALLNR